MSSKHLARSSKYPELGAYSELSSEYYDPIKHPTCADFRDASRILLQSLIDDGVIQPEGFICEVGAGKSLLAEVLIDLKGSLEGILITDISYEMLAYSNDFRDHYAGLLAADANCLPFQDGAMDCLFAILSDPYNVPRYWEESARVLRPGGMMLFVVPSYVWASKFRSSDADERNDVARFETSIGTELNVPSYIFPAREQIGIARVSGFEDVDFRTVRKSHLRKVRSPKLCLLEPNDAVVEGYVFRKRQGF